MTRGVNWHRHMKATILFMVIAAVVILCVFYPHQATMLLAMMLGFLVTIGLYIFSYSIIANMEKQHSTGEYEEDETLDEDSYVADEDRRRDENNGV